MELDYGMLLSPVSIPLSVGTLRKPTMREISELTFQKFSMFEAFLKITPEEIYTSFIGDPEENKWDSLPEDTRDSLTVYDCILDDENLQGVYRSIFDFFFEENVIYYKNLFVLLNEGFDAEHLTEEAVRGVISEKNFQSVLECIQQTCCIYTKKEEEKERTFKNDLARKMYEKMKKAQAEREKAKQKQTNLDYSLPNIMSAISNRHPSINPINVWDMTLFQLIDSFNRLQVNAVYDIDCTRVSVWGDDRKKFDISLWYKNNQEKQKDDDF